MEASAPSSETKKSALPFLLGGGLAAGIVMAVLVLAGRNLAALYDTQHDHGVGANAPQSIPDVLQVGMTAPDFETVDPKGNPIRLSDYRGSKVALNFWATWCAPCIVEMPALQSTSEEFEDGFFVVLGINASESAPVVQDFLNRYGLTFPIGLDPTTEINDLYGIRVYPTTIWIDEEGVITAEHLGPLNEAQIHAYLGVEFEHAPHE